MEWFYGTAVMVGLALFGLSLRTQKGLTDHKLHVAEHYVSHQQFIEALSDLKHRLGIIEKLLREAR